MINHSHSSNVVWNMNYSGVVSAGVYTTTSNSSVSNNVTFEYIIKRCRECKHAHAQEGARGCYDVCDASIAFVVNCHCKEHVPEDNLEYLEYLIKKKEPL